jgi:histidine racemase
MDTVISRLVVAYPSGNTTAIVLGEPPTRDLKALNAGIMLAWQSLRPDQPPIEQCCNVTAPRSTGAIARCEMFGGEFCGNAARSVALLLADGEDRAGTIEVSGVDHPLAFNVRKGEVTLEMPVPDTAGCIERTRDGILVRLDGITHLVVAGPHGGNGPRRLLDRLVRGNSHGFADQPAAGVCLYDPGSGEARFCIRVRDIGSVFDETAYGSGTCAIGMAAAWERGEPVVLEVIQPSGESISVAVDHTDGRIKKAAISGTVSILYDGEMRLE